MKKVFFALIAILLCSPLMAQDSVTVKDYQRAEKFLGYRLSSLVDNNSLNPNWISGDKFWYMKKEGDASRYYVADGKKKSTKQAFNHNNLAKALTTKTGREVSADKLSLLAVDFSADLKQLYFKAFNQSWKYNISRNALTEGENEAAGQGQVRGRSYGVSPDGTKRAFIKDYNLWIHDIPSGKEYPLTRDGIEDYGYATDNAGWKHSSNPVLLWSHDSKKIATFRQDERNVGEMYLVTTNVGHPKLERWKYPLAGDSMVAMIERVIIHVDEANPKIVKLNIPPDYHRATLGDDVMEGSELADAQWSPDNQKLAFVSSSRDHKEAKLRVADAGTGAVREVLQEKVATQFESGQNAISWRYLFNTNEVLWYSERDDWGHLYLYDALTGELKNQVTKGEYVVSSLTRVDEKNRKVYFMAAGLDKKNPYFMHYGTAGFDGTGFKDLTPEEGHHSINHSPNEEYFVNTWSQPDVPPAFNFRDIKGNKIADLGSADISRLKEEGWKPTIPFTVKAADGVTDIYGLMFTPTHLDESKKYPIVDYIYPGPQSGSVGHWGFSPTRGDNQALAELGFIVIAIEGTSNPWRRKSFHDMSYGNMGENTLPDQVTGIRQLAQRHSFIDTNRVGIWGHSGGGFATADALFTYPDFFKVGVSQAGNHDNRNYEDDWGERYIGLLEHYPDGTSNYSRQANQNYAANLKGKLMLAHGMMDNNVPPYNTLLVVQALQDANKDFDLVIFPESRHGFGKYNNYMTRLRWDYFVKHLKGALHPKEYKIGN